MASSFVFYSRQVNAPKVCIASVCVFISSWCMAWMLSIKYFVLFYSNFKIFPKLTDYISKMASSFIFYSRQVNAPKVCITSVCVFISYWCMAWILSIKSFVFFAEIFRISLNWRTHLQNDVIFGILFASGQWPYGLYYIRLYFYKFLFWLECYRSNPLSFLLQF